MGEIGTVLKNSSENFSCGVRLAYPCLLSIYGENGGQTKNQAEMQDGIKKPGELAKMQSPGEGEWIKFFGASAPQYWRSAPVKGGFGVATPTSSGPGGQMSKGEIWATGRYLLKNRQFPHP